MNIDPFWRVEKVDDVALTHRNMQIPGRSIRINTKIDRVDNWRGNHVTSEAGNFHNFSPVLFSTAELSQQTSGEKEKTRRSSLFFLQREDVRKRR